MKRILVVDDSKTILALLQIEIAKYPDLLATYAKNYKEAMEALIKNAGMFHGAILDLDLPDAQSGEIIKLANVHKVPSIVLSATSNINLIETVTKMDIIDFILKDEPSSIKFAVKSIQRTLKNYDTYTLVVDDSSTSRKTVKNILKKIKLNVFEATNGEDALLVLEKNPKIKLVITNYEMQKMNGLDLTFKIREKYKKDQLSIIAINTTKTEDTISKFLRFGANDFVNKPFNANEIITRVNSNLEFLDMFEQIKNQANRDFLTGMFNRRYFFDSGESIFYKNKRKKNALAVAMIDIDKFKNINDTYGHDVGDDAIIEVKNILNKNLRASDLVARFGGEEFCVLLENIEEKDIQLLFEKIRLVFEKNIIVSHNIEISYTVSIGIFFGTANTFDEMIKFSDEALYDAKNNGRNQVRFVK